MPKFKRLTMPEKYVDKDVLTLARERVSRTFDLFDHVCVSFSGGKDSTIVLHLALEEHERRGLKKPLDVIFWDEEAIPWQTVEYVERVAQNPRIAMRWYCVEVKHRNACSNRTPWWYCWNHEEKEKWVRPLPPRAITELPGFKKGWTIPNANGVLFEPPEKYGRVGMMMGIRAQESMTRRRAVTLKEHDNYIIRYQDFPRAGRSGSGERGHIWKVYPIYDWRTEDVWTAPKKYGWDYNKAYDLMDKAGISPHGQRVAPPFGEEPMQLLWHFKVCFPEIWDKMHNRVPGAATAARYSRTELYAFGARPEKPNDLTWEQFIVQYLEKLPAKERAMVADGVKGYIRRHYKLTSDPILYSAPHPLSGISWEYLLMLAVRGDFKLRKRPRYAGTDEKQAEFKVKYDEALTRYKNGDLNA